MSMSLRLALAVLGMPGVVFHELGHLVFCKLVGARVHKVALFRLGDPAGYVVHTLPRRFSAHFAIVAGPFVVNSVVAFAIFRFGSAGWASLSLSKLSDPAALAFPLLVLWLGTAIALRAFPSKGDARSLWQGANGHVRRGNLLAVVGYPFIALIYAANFLRLGHVDFAYALLLFIVASVL